MEGFVERSIIYSYEDNGRSNWGRYTIRGDTLITSMLERIYRDVHKKIEYKYLIKGDTLLRFHIITGERIPPSKAYAVHNPYIKLDFIDTRKAWIYKYNPYPDELE